MLPSSGSSNLYAVRGSPILQTLDPKDWSGDQTMAA